MLRWPLSLLLLLASLSAIVAAPPAAARVVTNERFSFTAQMETCSGELITVDVDVHLVARVTTDANGVPHLGSTVTTHSRGTSASGARYRGTSHQTTQLLGPVGSERVHTETFNQNLIRLGEDGTADDLRARAVNHFTFNAKGELVSSKFEFTFECR
jgi:hypothetical protein